MSARDMRPAYAAAVAAVFSAVALWRSDLVLDAARVSLGQLAAGGALRWRLLAEGALFASILAFTIRTVGLRAEPRRDSVIALLAGLAGLAAEAWGTRSGLWRYYTGERPPLWIVPAWSLGALVVDRVGAAIAARTGPVAWRDKTYWSLAAVALAVVAAFSRPRLLEAPTLLALGLTAAALAAGAEPRRETGRLLAGLACVFFADLWGVTNGCWGYYLQKAGVGAWKGIVFGMCFDTALVVGCLRAADALPLPVRAKAPA